MSLARDTLIFTVCKRNLQNQFVLEIHKAYQSLVVKSFVVKYHYMTTCIGSKDQLKGIILNKHRIMLLNISNKLVIRYTEIMHQFLCTE